MQFIADTDYRVLPRVSNSDLTQFKEEHLGYGSNVPTANPDRARVFGRAFHQHLLQPETVGAVMQQLLPDLLAPAQRIPVDTLLQDNLAQDNLVQGNLVQAVRNDAFCQRYLARSERGRVVLWNDPATGIGCKVRFDMLYTSPKRRNALIIDLKPTSARTQAQFLESCYTYDYDRQAAFYIDSLRHANSGEWVGTQQFRFVFVGVMQQRPNRLFAVDATSIPGFVDYGRKKYRFWLRKWREENGVGTDGQWTPEQASQPYLRSA